MATPEVLELNTLLEPIPGDDPAGSDLRTDSNPNSLYYQIKDARNTARAAERQAILDGDETGKADWRPVIRFGQKALTERAKDLEVVSYMIEGLARIHGFAGMRDGFKLARELVERFWDGLYPRPDEDGMETRLAPMTSLNGDDAEGTLITPIAKIPLSAGGDAEYATYHYQTAVALAQLPDEATREVRIQQGAASMVMIERSVNATPTAFYADLLHDLDGSNKEFDALNKALEERCGSKAPPASNIRSAITACREALLAMARHKLPAGDGTQVDGQTGGGALVPASGGTSVVSGSVRGRDDALQMLLRVADFFRRTEPHTPLSYALEQAVRWGRMTLPELLTDLIEDQNARQALFHRVGIKPPEESS